MVTLRVPSPRQYGSDRAWADRFIPQLKMIAGAALLRTAEPIDDTRRATDLIWLSMGGGEGRIACRMRRFEHLASYGHEFTIRARRDNGAETELAKLAHGEGDYLIYAFADAEERRLAAWLVGDLAVFRAWRAAVLDLCGIEPGIEIDNGDGTIFRAYRIDELPVEFVILRRAAA